MVEPERVAGPKQLLNAWIFRAKPPVDDDAHRHQGVAPSSIPDVLLTSDRDAFLAAASRQVLAKGELVGLYQQKIKPAKR